MSTKFTFSFNGTSFTAEADDVVTIIAEGVQAKEKEFSISAKGYFLAVHDMLEKSLHLPIEEAANN